MEQKPANAVLFRWAHVSRDGPWARARPPRLTLAPSHNAGQVLCNARAFAVRLTHPQIVNWIHVAQARS